MENEKREVLIFAHYGEAKTLIKELGLKKNRSLKMENLYSNKSQKLFVLITGEGVESALFSSTSLLSALSDVERVINYGVCGTLRSGFEVGQLFPIRTIYRQGQNSHSMIFKSFTCLKNEKEVDLVTANERVLTSKVTDSLDNFAPLVDREAWAIAYSCDQLSIPISVFKVVSDQANGEICAQVREESELWSDLIYRHYISLKKIHFQTEPSLIELYSLQTEFYLTVSQERKVNSLLKSLLLKEINIEELLNSKEVKCIKESEIRKKDKTKQLITIFQKKLRPLEEKISLELREIFSPLKNAGIMVKFEEGLENANLHLTFDWKKEAEREQFIKALKHFNFSKWQEITEGKI